MGASLGLVALFSIQFPGKAVEGDLSVWAPIIRGEDLDGAITLVTICRVNCWMEDLPHPLSLSPLCNLAFQLINTFFFV